MKTILTWLINCALMMLAFLSAGCFALFELSEHVSRKAIRLAEQRGYSREMCSNIEASASTVTIFLSILVIASVVSLPLIVIAHREDVARERAQQQIEQLARGEK